MRTPLVVAIGCAMFGAFAQAGPQQSGSVAGRVVTDGSSAPGITITLTAPGVERQTTTDSNGTFAIEDLPPGRYSVRAHLFPFRPETSDLEIAQGRPAEANFVIRLGVFAHVRVPFFHDHGAVLIAWPQGQLGATETVVRLRIVERLGTGLLGPDCLTPRCPEGTWVSTRHAATVLDVAKSSPTAPFVTGDRIEFWQLLAGERRDGDAGIVGQNAAYEPGEEVIAFLRRDRTFDTAAVASPLPHLLVRDGAVYGIPSPAAGGFRDGMSVDSFLAAVGALVAGQPRVGGSPPR